MRPVRPSSRRQPSPRRVLLATTAAVAAAVSTLVPTALGKVVELEPVRLWPGRAPNETWPGFPGPEVTQKGVDGHSCGLHRDESCDHILNVSEPTLTPFLVENGTGAAVVIAPGGGYRILAWNLEGVDIARLYNSFGISAFVLKYRVPARPSVEGLPKWWAPLQDAQRAMRLVRYRADRGLWRGANINSSRIGFTGFSAGGHLTGHISVAYANSTYVRVDDADAETARPDFSIFGYPWMLLPDNKTPRWGDAFALASEFMGTTGTGVSKDHPVSLFIHNEDDSTAPVQGSIAYYTKMLSEGAPFSTLHVYNSGGHGFGLCQKTTEFLEVCDWPKVAQRFLQDHGFAEGFPSGKPTTYEMTHQNC